MLYVYKYITWEKNYHKEILLGNKIFFPFVRKCNIPLDSTVPSRYDSGNDAQTSTLCAEYSERPP